MKSIVSSQPKHFTISFNILPSELSALKESWSQNQINPEEGKNSKIGTPHNNRENIRSKSKNKGVSVKSKENSLSSIKIQPIKSLYDSLIPQNTNDLRGLPQTPESIQKNRIKTELYPHERTNLFHELTRSSSKTKTIQSSFIHSPRKSRVSFNKCESKEKCKVLNKTLGIRNKKMREKMDKIKQYKFVEEYLTDLELEGILNQLEVTNVPESQWGIAVVDKIYQIIRKKDFNIPHQQIIRKF